MANETPAGGQKFSKLPKQDSRSLPVDNQEMKRCHVLVRENAWIQQQVAYVKETRRGRYLCKLCTRRYFRDMWSCKRHLQLYHLSKGIKVGTLLTVMKVAKRRRIVTKIIKRLTMRADVMLMATMMIAVRKVVRKRHEDSDDNAKEVRDDKDDVAVGDKVYWKK